MALTPTSIYAELSAARAAGAFPLAGLQSDALLRGIANGVGAWAVGQPQNVALTGIATGAVGGGTIGVPTTKVVMLPNIPGMMGALTGAGIAGQLSSSLATVVSVGISSAFTKYAQYSGVVAGVGSGLDVSKVTVANVPSLQTLLYASLGGSFGSVGLMTASLATGLANGISLVVLTGTGTGSVVGVPGPSPGTGTSTSVIV